MASHHASIHTKKRKEGTKQTHGVGRDVRVVKSLARGVEEVVVDGGAGGEGSADLLGDYDFVSGCEACICI